MYRKLSALLLAPVALLGFSQHAQAADILYNVSGGSLTPSASFTGSFLLNTTTGNIDSGAFTFLTSYGTFNLSTTTPGTFAGADSLTDANGDVFRLAINGPNPISLNTLGAYGSLDDSNLVLYSQYGVRYDVTGSTVTAATAANTPEPSSLILLGTGVLAGAGAIRRRFLS